MPLAAGLVLVVLAALPLAVWLVVTARPGRLVSTRTVPADVARIGIMVAFVAWVNPYWGACAALAAYHWLRRGWTMVEGGLLWPTMAMGLYLGMQADQRWLDAALAFALVLGVLQSGVAVAQRCGAPIFTDPTTRMIHGTLGHRTGLGMYLAMLVPLGFLTDYGLPLAAIYGIGLCLSWSLMAWLATVAAVVVLAPVSLVVVLPVAGVGIATRLIKWNHGHPKLRHVGDSWRARWNVWRTVGEKLQRWPAWLIGNGAFAFASDSRQWIGRTKMVEVYKEAHNDYVEFAYEYGALGCVAMTGYVASVYPVVAWRDPVTASAAALGVAMLGQFPLRVAPLLGLGGLIAITLMRRLG